MGRFGEKKNSKRKFYAARRLIKIYDVNVDNLVVSKLIKTRINSKC